MPAPKIIHDLVERFERNKESYQATAYNETQLRREFLDSFFGALGWDVNNEQGYAEAYKEVIHEDHVKIGDETKAPDYCFRIGGARKFFLEAKKPSVNLKDDPSAAYQLRRYAWSVKLPLSVLSDFAELAVYDCRVKPSEKDKATVARILYITFDEYEKRWDEIAAIFSREAVLKGSFDQYAETTKTKKGTTEVDEAFLEEMSEWRNALASSIALRNAKLSQGQLNYTVQMTIDRIIFLRICEDRGIEQYGQLRDLAKGDDVYSRLGDLFHRADDRYNSGLFHFRKEKDRSSPDDLTLKLTIDDKVLKDIVKRLYYPESPYVFYALPADILGQVYEQFLGKVIRLTPAHRAVIEDKPEVKKAGGVFYTPTYIVNYIVQNTVGKLCDGKTPDDVAKLRLLDPACGSGSFLLGAYQFLLDWHWRYYVDHDPQKLAKKKTPTLTLPHRGTTDGGGQGGGEWRLTTGERKRILLNNIYGVDIDPQAVEVTKLSLLLKVLEGESDQTLNAQMALLQERALPDLNSNIKCGNSLIAPDFYEQTGKQMNLIAHDEEERARVNVFDWESEFQEVFTKTDAVLETASVSRTRGFDAVIGNPPYGAELTEEQKDYLRNIFSAESKSFDTYELFLLKGNRLLCKNGLISMIIPSSWFTGEKYQLSRHKLVNDLYPAIAYALPFDVFKNAYIDTAIIVLTSTSQESCLIHFFPKKEKLLRIPNVGDQVPISSIRQDTQNRLSTILSEKSAPILQKMNGFTVKFGDWFEISRGVQPYSRSKHAEEQIANKFLHASTRKTKQHLPELQGNELSRYFVESERKSYLKYCNDIASIRPMRMFEGERIVLRRLLTRKFRLQASVTTETMITTDNVLNMIPANVEAKVKFALGLLNSKLISWVYVNSSMIAQKDDFPQVHISALSDIRLPNHNDKQVQKMVSLVERMLALHKQSGEMKTPHDKDRLQREIEATDKQIDALVYELYGLSEDEVRIVEGK